MGDYFHEMGWEPVPLEETQRHQNLLVIRELIANGLIRDDLAFDLPPPAARALVQNLKERTPEPTDEKCTICLKPNADVVQDEAKFIVLPCSHEFHKTCIMPWLDKVCLLDGDPDEMMTKDKMELKTNSCPLCRYEMETDDASYEQWKENRRRLEDSERNVERLHDSMFS